MENKYDYKKTVIKVLWVTAEIAVAGTIAYLADNPGLIFLAPTFEAVLDYIKHKN
jgi:phage shock protein PspC (stress-responsive transcriptional regulator)